MFSKTFTKALILAALAAFLCAPTVRAADDGVTRAIPVKTPPPVYPNELRRDGIAGLVTVKVVIDEKGDVAECSINKSTRSEFEQPALNAIRSWKFRPTSKDGTPVRSAIIIPVKFSNEA